MKLSLDQTLNGIFGAKVRRQLFDIFILEESDALFLSRKYHKLFSEQRKYLDDY